jgi:hypothetical protein
MGTSRTAPSEHRPSKTWLGTNLPRRIKTWPRQNKTPIRLQTHDDDRHLQRKHPKNHRWQTNKWTVASHCSESIRKLIQLLMWEEKRQVYHFGTPFAGSYRRALIVSSWAVEIIGEDKLWDYRGFIDQLVVGDQIVWRERLAVEYDKWE